jgi:hypothetical protein
VRATICTKAQKSVDDEIEHGKLTNALFSSGKDPLIALGTLLNDLYTARQKADYKLNPDASWARKLADPQYAELRAKQALDALRQLPTIDFTPVLGKL